MDLDRSCRAIVDDPGKSSADRLAALLAATWEWEMAEFPERATWTGWREGHDRWCDRSREAIARRRRQLAAPLAAARTIARGELAPKDRLNLDLFLRERELTVEESKFPGELLALTQMDGVHQDPAQLLSVMDGTSERALSRVISRLQRLPALIGQVQELLADGLSRGITPPRICLRDVPRQIENLCTAAPEQSPLLAAFAAKGGDVTAERRTVLQREGATLVERGVVPALRTLQKFLVERYLPGAREEVGFSALPDGEAWYAFKVREQTTTSLTPKEIHQIGLDEVARIRGLMDATVREAGFGADFAGYCDHLRSDRRYYFETPQQLLTAYRDLCKRIDPELVRFFGRLPRLPYGVVEVPAYSAESQTTAYYLPGSPEAARPGLYYANTSKLDARPKWEMEALSLHEAVPGHHLQIALAQELDLPLFRRHGGPNAYVEGWALYCEGLGGEFGLYREPESRFGQLSYEMWRAIRLVVDTGIHAFGWSRQRAIDFFAGNTGKPLHDIVVEIDRYIVWPAQALSYKIGQLEIERLKREARAALGERFDVRAFHDELLAEGALPLDVLGRRIREFIARLPPAAGGAGAPAIA